MTTPNEDIVARLYSLVEGQSRHADTVVVQAAEEIKALRAIAEAAAQIPRQPSMAHRLLTPGWEELFRALVAYRSAYPSQGEGGT